MNHQDKIHVLSRAVITHENKILLCHTLDCPINFYFLPGGHIEHSESAANALLRELKEETGANCKVKKFLGCLEYSFEPAALQKLLPEWLAGNSEKKFMSEMI